MPIKPENKSRYPADWKEISFRIRFVRANNRCEQCGIINHLTIKRLKGDEYRVPCLEEWDMMNSAIRYGGHNWNTARKKFGFIRIVLTVAHLDNVPENCEDENLKALCQRCHNRHDVDHRKKTRNASNSKNQLKIDLI